MRRLLTTLRTTDAHTRLDSSHRHRSACRVCLKNDDPKQNLIPASGCRSTRLGELPLTMFASRRGESPFLVSTALSVFRRRASWGAFVYDVWAPVAQVTVRCKCPITKKCACWDPSRSSCRCTVKLCNCGAALVLGLSSIDRDFDP